MTSIEKSPQGKGCRRMLVWLVLLTTLSIGTIVALLATGVPQRQALKQVLSSQLGAQVDVGTLSLRNPFAIQSLTLTDAAASLYGPLVRTGPIAVAYRWQWDAPRHIESVTLNGLNLSIQGDGERKNFQFVQDLLAAPSESTWDPTPWLPETVRMDDFRAEASFPAYALRLENIAATAALYSLTDGSLSVRSSELGLAWQSELAGGEAQSHQGALNLDLAWEGSDLKGDIHADFGRLAQLEAALALTTRDNAPYIDIDIPSARLDDPLWSAVLAEHLPTPIQFDDLTLADVRLGLHLLPDGLRVDAAELDGAVTTIIIGPPEMPYYKGPIQVALHGNYGATTAVEGTVTLADGRGFTGRIALDDDGMTGEFDVPPWPRGVITALLPPDYAAYLDIVPPLKTLGAKGTLRQRTEGLSVAADLTTQFGESEAMKVPLTISMVHGPDEDTLEVTTAVALGSAKVDTRVEGPLKGPWTLSNDVKAVSVPAWTKTLLGKAIVPELGGDLTGSVKVIVPPEGPLAVTADLSGTKMAYGNLVLPGDGPLAIKAVLDYDLDKNQVRGKSMALAQESNIDLTSTAWQFDIDSGAFRAAMKTALSLSAVGEMFQLTELYGDATLAGDLAVDAATVRLANVTAQSGDLGYGDYSVPYGATLYLDGGLNYDYAEVALTLAPIEARLDEGTRITTADLTFLFPTDARPFSMSATPFALVSDMSLLQTLGYLKSVSGGRATLQSDALSWANDTFGGLSSWDVTAESLVLSDDMAELTNLASTGSYDPGTTETGSGRVTADSVAVYGMPFGAVDTGLTINDKRLACSGLKTTFLGGTLHLDATVDYQDPAWPVSADARVERIDLEEFTKTFEPPDVILTGHVSGKVILSLTMDGLTSLDVDLEATENLSLNRSMVRQILMSQYVNDAVGSKSVQKIIEKVIGTTEQRPFDKAILDLNLEDGLIVGVARLESKSLDVTVDISAEPAAILEAIRSSME